jgi:hypothetical protein
MKVPSPSQIRDLRVKRLVVFARALIKRGASTYALADRVGTLAWKLWSEVRTKTRHEYVEAALRTVLEGPHDKSDLFETMRQAPPQEGNQLKLDGNIASHLERDIYFYLSNLTNLTKNFQDKSDLLETMRQAPPQEGNQLKLDENIASHPEGDIVFDLDNLDRELPVERQSLQDKRDLALKIFTTYPDETLGENTVLNLPGNPLGIGEEEGRALLKILVQDGSIFQPRPGYYKLTGGG